jgi:hypothetical protein
LLLYIQRVRIPQSLDERVYARCRLVTSGLGLRDGCNLLFEPNA